MSYNEYIVSKSLSELGEVAKGLPSAVRAAARSKSDADINFLMNNPVARKKFWTHASGRMASRVRGKAPVTSEKLIATGREFKGSSNVSANSAERKFRQLRNAADDEFFGASEYARKPNITKGLPSYARQLQRAGKLVPGAVDGGLGSGPLGRKIASNRLGRAASIQIAGGPATRLGQGANGVGRVIEEGKKWPAKFVTRGQLGGRTSTLNPTTTVEGNMRRLRASRQALMAPRQAAAPRNVLP